jgi:hypothetical protein
VRQRLLAGLAGLLTSAAAALAQAPAMVKGPDDLVIVMDPAQIATTKEAPKVVNPGPDAPTPVRSDNVFWNALPPLDSGTRLPFGTIIFSADYLLWFVDRASINEPLITTGSAKDPKPGAIGQPNTSVLYGYESASFGAFSGYRFGLGLALGEGWLVEGNYFGLETREENTSFFSDNTGNPVIARPYLNSQTGASGAYPDSLSKRLAGSATVSLTSRLAGYEANVANYAYQDESIGFEWLLGFRALELTEELGITDHVIGLAPKQLSFLGAPVEPPSSLNIVDSFHNKNCFYGGQIGGRVHWLCEGLDVAITAKVAVGATQQAATLDGYTNLITPGAPPTLAPGGILVQPNNIGTFQMWRLSYVPEGGLDEAYWLTPHIRLGMGYQFLYWSSVARPGDEINPNVNPAQVPRDPRFGKGPSTAAPTFAFHNTDYWAQGVHLGVLFQY